MSRTIPFLAFSVLWRLAIVLLVVVVMVLSGCAQQNLRGDGFAKDETFDMPGRVRPSGENVDLFGFSNKARQIERNFGAR